MRENNNAIYVFKFIEFHENKYETERTFKVRCSEDELIGVKENIAMQLERYTNNIVLCKDIIKWDQTETMKK